MRQGATLDWFKPRYYRHFDLPVNEAFALKVMKPEFVSLHPFSPLIHYEKVERKYKKDPHTKERKINEKLRPIKYASHRDACILSYYSHVLNLTLEGFYEESGVGECAVAYRALGKGNYDFAAEALAFARKHERVTILAFDVSSFFDTLDHGLLKRRLKSILGVEELSKDWYKIYKVVTNFYFVDIDDLKANNLFKSRLREKGRRRIASLEELKAQKITFHQNPEIKKGNNRGIPQGAPISASLSNLYMTEFDVAVLALCKDYGALYRRYSDDILVVCNPEISIELEAQVSKLLEDQKLDIAAHKTERTLFDINASSIRTSRAAQYLGFSLDEGGAAIRESSLSRQWRKMRKAIRRAKKSAVWRASAGKSTKIYRKKLFRRFSHLKINDGASIRTIRNFSSYGRRSAAVFGQDEKISHQVKRFERRAQKELKALKNIGAPLPPAP